MWRYQLLSDRQWKLIADRLPHHTGQKGRPFADGRRVVEGIVYRHRTGIAWRQLPAAFGPWQTIWAWHKRLVESGEWRVIMSVLAGAGERVGPPVWSGTVDVPFARAHRRASSVSRAGRGFIELQIDGARTE